jgi:hypothetical protein
MVSDPIYSSREIARPIPATMRIIAFHANRLMKNLGRLTHPVGLALWLLLSLSSAPAHAVGWLATSGDHLINPDGSTWIGRGANLHDTRSCGGGTLVGGVPINDDAAGVAEVKRRIDVLTDVWKATFIRLALETDHELPPGYSYTENAAYRNNVIDIVNYIGTKPGVYVLVAIWQDPSLVGPPNTNVQYGGSPTAATNAILSQLATDFYASPHVLYGVSNEPENNFDPHPWDVEVWTRMNAAVAAIRTAENALGGVNHHIVTVQGTRDWARDLGYYDAAHPITAGGGANVAYETHIYNSPGDFAALLLAAPGPRTIPVIVGEFGPIGPPGPVDPFHAATVADMQTLINLANANNIPWLAWTFHQYCPPNLIADVPGKTWNDNSTPVDFHGMPIYPTDFGQLLKDNLLAATPALLDTSFDYNVTSTSDNVLRPATAQVTMLNNFGAEKRPVVVLMPGWGGVGDVLAARDAQTLMFANQGYVALNIGFHQTSDVPAGPLAAWYSDLAESAKAALDDLCLNAYADCSAVVITGESYGGTQIHPVVRFLRAGGAYDGSNAVRKVLAMLGQDSGYTLYGGLPENVPEANADATLYSIAMIQNLGDLDFPVDTCDFGNCGARNRADYHQAAAGSQFVVSYCPPGGSHGDHSGYADWDAWVLSAVKTMLHNQRGVPKFTGYVEPSLAVSNACLTTPLALVGVVSRKTHGASGAFDVTADTAQPIGGTITVEPRQIGAGHSLVFSFNGAITATGTASMVDALAAPVGTATPAISGNNVVVTLTGIPDNQRVTVSLTNVNNAGVNASTSMGFLVGDVNNSRSVTATDILQVKGRSGQVTDATNFKFDVNASGSITASDILAVKGRSGLVLP